MIFNVKCRDCDFERVRLLRDEAANESHYHISNYRWFDENHSNSHEVEVSEITILSI